MNLRRLWFGVPHERFCTQCRLTKRVTGGRLKVYAKGMRQRWICADCAEAEDARGMA